MIHYFDLCTDEGCSDAVQYLVDPEGASASDSAATAIAPVATKAVKGVHKAFEAVVGMDEPPSEMA